MICELRSENTGLLERAAIVLRGSHPHPPDPPASLVWQAVRAQDPPGWDTEHVSDGHDWLIRRVDTGETWQRTTSDSVLRCVEFGSIMALVDGPFGVVTLHGALLDRNGRGLLIVGPRESGKSTLATALWQEGWTLLGDDVAVAQPDGLATVLPRRVSLRHSSRDLLGEPLWSKVRAARSCSMTGEGYLFHPSELDSTPPPACTRLAAIVFLARRGVQLGPADVAPINKAQALLSLTPYSNVVRRAGLAEALQRLQPLAADGAPAFDLGRGPLPRMIDAIERHVREAEGVNRR